MLSNGRYGLIDLEDKLDKYGQEIQGGKNVSEGQSVEV